MSERGIYKTLTIHFTFAFSAPSFSSPSFHLLIQVRLGLARVAATRLSRGGADFPLSPAKYKLPVNNRYLFHSPEQTISILMSYKEEKPEFGHAMLKHFAISPSYLNLNNGT